VAFAIGGVSALMGLGGGTIGVPALTVTGYTPERARSTASAFGVLIAVSATAAAVLTGFYAGGRPPFSLGYVSLPAVLLIAPTLFFASRAGAALAQVIDRDRLRKVLALFIAVAAVRLLWELLS
jgi:uncharacterized membrane protein YfcA